MDMMHRLRGFAWLKVILALAIVAVLVIAALKLFTVPKPGVVTHKKPAVDIMRIKQDTLAIQSALDQYKLDNGVYPSTEQGLQALVTMPSTPPLPSHWRTGGYLNQIPVDPWGQPYQYVNNKEKVSVFSKHLQDRTD
ncbi:MAG: type II secretion system major pseudopilin GspG [Coxiellaceae bacterium]|nr:MAG: type II secretion system major pseudopilin GspG [Coxiellaceae bacterium]